MNNQEFDNKIKAHMTNRKLKVSEEAWNKLALEAKQETSNMALVWFRTVAALIVFALGLYYVNSGSESTVVATPAKKQKIKEKTTDSQEDHLQEVLVKELPEKQQKIHYVTNPQPKETFGKTSVVKSKIKQPIQIKPNNKRRLKKDVFKNTEVVANALMIPDKISNKIKPKQMEENTGLELIPDAGSVANHKRKEKNKESTGINKKVRKRIKIDAIALMSTIEKEIESEKEMRFRERMIFKVTESFSYVAQTFETD